MAFINKYMTQLEVDAFKARKIPAPIFPSRILESRRWTIDYERNMFLVWASQPREYRGEATYFVFGWNEIYIPMLLKKTRLTTMTFQWSFMEFKIPKELSEHKQELINNLKDALKIYGLSGFPTNPNNNLYKVEFDF